MSLQEYELIKPGYRKCPSVSTEWGELSIYSRNDLQRPHWGKITWLL